MECGIAQVVPVGDTWSAECCIAVSQLLAERIITVHLVETLENGHIHAVDIKLSMGEYIGGGGNTMITTVCVLLICLSGKLSTILIERGYATGNHINATPTEQEIRKSQLLLPFWSVCSWGLWDMLECWKEIMVVSSCLHRKKQNT